jgi:Zn finger protein HypA/HybF involved in hydrogenase expression
MIYKCQCCNKDYEVDYNIFIYSICPHCMWEQDNVEPDEYSDPNGCTLIEYRNQKGIDV